jgi:catechol 2,3-dioxygenase-like lactoylglutathione lyase family enzyme
MGDLVSHTDFVFMPTRDFDAASAFYRDVLGLECSTRYGGAPGGEFETGNLTLVLLDVGRDAAPGGTGMAIALRVDDVAAARERLESEGVVFHGGIVDSGVCHQAFFNDPDGNGLILHHRYAPPGA